MNPDPNKKTQDDIRGAAGLSYIPRKDHAVVPTPRQYLEAKQAENAAANVARAQIEHVYNTNPPNQLQTEPKVQRQTQATIQPVSEQKQDSATVYAKNLEDEKAPDYDWRQYHSAWQHYYQQYYGSYYKKHLEEREQLLQEQVHLSHQQSETVVSQTPKEISPTEKLRQDLVATVKKRAEKVRSSRHFMPLMMALFVGGIFFLLQFNKIIGAEVQAYVSPSSAITDKEIFDPNTTAAVSPDPKLIIPKINVEAPVDYALNSLDNPTVQKSLENAVVHYPIPGADSVPGQTGNAVYLGHSSNEVFAPGNYKFVFVRLDQMEKGDQFYLNYNGIRYVYRVTEKMVIKPSEVSKLILPKDKAMATIITCTPIGTATNRLLVFGEQISPDPAAAVVNDAAGQSSGENVAIPGNQPSLLESLFGN